MSRGPWKIAASTHASYQEGGAIATFALGIDVGLSSVRAAVVSDLDGLLGSGRTLLPSSLSGPGRAEQDPHAWLEAAFRAGAEAVSQAGVTSVDVVGIGALGPAPLLVDSALEPLTPALLFALDSRADAERVGLGLESADHALPKLRWWAAHEPALVRKAAYALDAGGYLVAALTGVPSMDTITAASYEAAGAVAPVRLPGPVDPLAVAGTLRGGAATRLGLREGTPAIAGTLDTYVDVAAAGVRAPGDACLLLGSTLVLCRAVEDAVAVDGLELSRYPGEGLLLGGWTAAGGSVLDWFRRELGAAGIAERAAELAPGAGGLLALPYLAGERTPVRDPLARGLVVGLTLRTGCDELYRALVDALALAARDHLVRFEAAGLAPPTWRAAGGGTRDPAWLQATADALGAPLELCAWAADAVGPALLALRSAGADLPRPVERVVAPDPARAELYERLYEVYRTLHPTLAEAMHALGELEGSG
jgi:xylulokinase